MLLISEGVKKRQINSRASSTASGGDAKDDTFTSMKRAYGSNFACMLGGDDANNLFYSYDGDDVLNGLRWNDILRRGAGNNVLDGSTGNDRLIGGIGLDTSG